ncbi:MAG: ornithine cyclodeaminase family protein [Anaerolineae bacterium]|nr:MAG: ornithine cyclodeaminase family protein [Anaerolineae bacterium]
MPLLYLTEADVQQTLTMKEAVALAEKGIRADAEGRVSGDKFYMSVGKNGFIKPFSGYLEGEEYAYVKIFSFFSENPGRGLPTTASQVLLYEARTGLPVCLMEAGWVTGLKTGASTAVTAKYLARAGAERAVIFGAGLQGHMHLRGLAEVFPLKRAWVVDIRPEAAERFAAELAPELGFPITVTPLEGREEAVRQADIVITVTTGNQPLVRRDWLKPGAFVAKLGSYQELDPDVITQADKVIVDRWKYVRPRVPELIALGEAGRFGEENVHAEWPQIVAGERAGREASSEVIVYIALGIWGEYAAILPEVYRQARRKGLGRELPLSLP